MRSKILLLFSGCLLVLSCKNEQAPAPVKPVDPNKVDCSKAKINTSYVLGAIKTNCTDRGCHRSMFSTPEGLKGYIGTKRETFEQRALSEQATMPPARFPRLSQGMKDSIACWIGRGMPDE
ncbi:MAG TPA: hypothetical protein VM802_18720 [Chitinophaga sp.]|uniref:hypothetical protein n=1 Tax=Chitinophaga sp. TaxID=1869181 RepID=UPI002C37B57A|nr:hypothetical protein [Chitinophaga sp.]HVI46920.1 hypothetical protein [Chitinophaga sp.]